MTNMKFVAIGITTLNGVSKIRYSNDTVRHTKKFIKMGATRIDFVDLPEEMSKIQSLNYMFSLPEFSSEDDQALIEETLETKEREASRKIPKVKMSIEDIAKRKVNDVTVSDILNAVI